MKLNFDKHLEIWEKSWHYIKKINSELIVLYNTKESFQCFYTKVIPVPVILINSVHRKDEKVFFKKYHSF